MLHAAKIAQRTRWHRQTILVSWNGPRTCGTGEGVKALKWIALGLGALVLIGVAVVAYLAATFDPDDYKPRIVALVKQQTGRTLTLDGKIGLTFFPRIGAALSKVTLSEPNSPTVFARVDFGRHILAWVAGHKLKQALRPEMWML